MKYFLVLILFFSPEAFAANGEKVDVTVHPSAKFSGVPAGSGTQFGARIFSWAGWAYRPQSGFGRSLVEERPADPIQDQLNLTSNPVFRAYEMGGKRYDLERLTEDDFYKVFGDDVYEADGAFEFYENREEIIPDEDIKLREKGAVFSSRTQIDLSDTFDAKSLNLEKVAQYVVRADSMHSHMKVDHKWAHQFMDPVHYGHHELEKHPNGQAYFSVINTGTEQYNCEEADEWLVYQAELQEISMYDESYRAYTIYVLDEVTDIEGYSSVVEAGAERVFVQKIIYSSNLLKTGINVISFYTNPETKKKKMIVASVLMSTDQVLGIKHKRLGNARRGSGVLEQFVNGYTPGDYVIGDIWEFLTGDIDFDETQQHAKLNAENMLIRVENPTNECESGLFLGIGSYIYNLGLKMSQMSLE